MRQTFFLIFVGVLFSGCQMDPLDLPTGIENNSSNLGSNIIPQDPPSDEPPFSEPPVTNPPTTNPPTTNPPTTNPPTTNPPTTNPPTTNPPTTNPPTTNPPTTNPPTTNPPTTNPPTTEPPTTEPPLIPEDPMKNEAKYTNSDGSLTIVRPTFKYTGTEHRVLYSSATPQGVCAMFNRPNVRHRSYESSTTVNGIYLTADGSFSGVGNSGASSFSLILDVTCDTDRTEPSVKSALPHAEKYVNGDQSITIREPRFIYKNQEMKIAYSSAAPQGICRMFGKETSTYRQYSTVEVLDYVFVSATGALSGANTSTTARTYISEVTCK